MRTAKLTTLLAGFVLCLWSTFASATSLFSDDFNRADNATVSATNWTENAAGDWSIVSNKVRSVNPLTVLVTKAAAHAAIADCKVTLKRALTGTSWDVGVLVRTNSTGTTGYFADPLGTGPSSTLDIWRIDGSLSTDVQIGGTVTVDINDGDIYALEVSGTGATVTLKAYINGVLKLTVTDSSASRITAAGQTGIINWNNTNDFDDFLVEDLLVPGAVIVNPISGGGGAAARPVTFNVSDAANDDQFLLRASR